MEKEKNYLQKATQKKPISDTFEALHPALQRGDATALARAITLAESHLPQHQETLRQLLLHKGERQALVVGITGVPGAGKSTFIEALGLQMIADGRRVAVLTVDPSSADGRGSILGDKTRMPRLARQAFVRPCPSCGTLGGTTPTLHYAIDLCEAAGYDAILIETVGTGQSETDIRPLVDHLLLLQLPNQGDELQGIKRGIMEHIDMIVVNKADISPTHTQQCVRQMSALHPHLPTLACSALQADGIPPIVATLNNLPTHPRNSRQQTCKLLDNELLRQLHSHPSLRQPLQEALLAVERHQTTPHEAIRRILESISVFR